MPRIADTSDALLSDFKARLERLVATATKEGRESALSELRSLVGGARAPGAAPRRRGPGRPAAKVKRARRRSGKPRKSSWAGLSDDQRLSRINAIRKGRGLPPKDAL